MLTDNSNGLRTAAAAIVNDLERRGVPPLRAVPTGSAYYGKNNPADYDTLVHLQPFINLESLVEELEKLGWKDCAAQGGQVSGGDPSTQGYGDWWVAVRLGAYNAIITNDQQWFYRQWAAGELCRMLAIKNGNAMPKEDVIDIFRLIRGDV